MQQKDFIIVIIGIKTRANVVAASREALYLHSATSRFIEKVPAGGATTDDVLYNAAGVLEQPQQSQHFLFTCTRDNTTPKERRFYFSQPELARSLRHHPR